MGVGRSFLHLRLALYFLRLVLLLTVNPVWSCLLTVESRFGRFAYGGKWVWSFLLTVPPVQRLGLVFSAYGSPRPAIGFGLLCLQFPHRK